MVFGMILYLCYAALRLLFALASLLDPSFRARLAEADLSFVVRSNISSSSGLFQLRGGKLRYRRGSGGEDSGISPIPSCREGKPPCLSSSTGPANFTVSWNGWGDADTWGKRLRLNMMAFLNTGMVSLEGDLSCLVTFFMLLGEALGCLARKKPVPVRRTELGKEIG